MIQFTDDCLLGKEDLDTDHRKLFSLLEEVHNLLHNNYATDRYDKIHQIIAELSDYADEHFAREEAYMVEIRDPELFRQRMQHTIFRDKINTFDCSALGEDEEQDEVLDEMVTFLARWLYGHIISSDALIGKLPPLEEWMVKENPCEFTDEYLVGIEFVDEQHRRLFNIVDRAYRLIRENKEEDHTEDIRDILRRLQEYTEFHFGEEEAYMKKIHYEGLEAQLRAHHGFIDRLNSAAQEDLENEGAEHLEELVEFLLNWLIQHILKMDKLIPTETCSD